MKLSSAKKEKISEQVLALLYSLNPKPLFTSHIATEIARDDGFTKNILLDLERKGLVSAVRKNPRGKDYVIRARWKLSDKAYNLYKERQ